MALMVAERMFADDGPSSVDVEEFEAVARAAARETESFRLEYIGGRIREKGMPDGNHNEIVVWLMQLCMQHRPELALYGGDQGLKVGKYRKGRARPDGSLAPRGTFVDAGEWASPADVLMTVEVTSRDQDTNARDRVEKPVGYAAAGIPLYLLIDRDAGEATVFSDPDPDRGYREKHTVPFGGKLELPAPVNMVLDTEPLKAYVR